MNQDVVDNALSQERDELLLALPAKLQKLAEDSDILELPTVAPVTAAVVSDAFAQLEHRIGHVGAVVLSYVDASDFRKEGFLGSIDPEHQAHRADSGFRGKLWGAQILATRELEPGYIFIVSMAGMSDLAAEHITRIKVTR